MKHKIAIIGLGYVGLPLARLFAAKYPVVGYDINHKRIAELNTGKDLTLEVEEDLLNSVLVFENPVSSGASATADSIIQTFKHSPTGLYCSSNPEDIVDANIYIITVPTPVDRHNRPDLTPLYKASEIVGKVLKKADTVIYESTVYPGVTEEECVPVLERVSGLKFNEDFFCGYSPERINPGDKQHTVENILKVTSGSTSETGRMVDDLYRSVIVAGTHLAPTIKVAEASKVIENAQRDINIAFVNELAKILSLMDINTQDVLAAAGTKWNFLPFKPGLVGGHCIGVDPFYLAQKAQDVGYYSELILTARRVNDSMGGFVAHQVVKAMIKKNIQVNGAEVLMLGITFKENCGDVRNTKIVDVIAALEEYGIKVTVYDPWANPEEVLNEYTLTCHNMLPCHYNPPKAEKESVIATEAKQSPSARQPEKPHYPIAPLPHQYDAVVLGVAHREFLDLDLNLMLKPAGIIYDVKGVLQISDHTL